MCVACLFVDISGSLRETAITEVKDGDCQMQRAGQAKVTDEHNLKIGFHCNQNVIDILSCAKDLIVNVANVVRIDAPRTYPECVSSVLSTSITTTIIR